MKRRTVLRGIAASATAAATGARVAIAQPARVRTLRLAPQANLTLLDPHFTTAQVTTNHAWAIYDTLFAVTANGEPRPQMAAGYSIEDDGHALPDHLARRTEIPQR